MVGVVSSLQTPTITYGPRFSILGLLIKPVFILRRDSLATPPVMQLLLDCLMISNHFKSATIFLRLVFC